MKKLLLVSFIFALTVSIPTMAEPTLQKQEEEALSSQEQGNYIEALQQWKLLRQNYKDNGLDEKVKSSDIQIALTQQSLGQIVAACYTFQKYFKISDSLCTPSREISEIDFNISLITQNDVIAAINFANILRDLGLYIPAYNFANEALTASERGGYESLTSDITIAKASILLAEVQQDFDLWKYQGRESLLTFDEEQLIADYQSIFQAYESSLASNIHARLKWIQLYQIVNEQANAYNQDLITAFRDSLTLQNTRLIQEIALSDLSNQNLSNREKIRLMLDKAQVLLKANHPESKQTIQELILATQEGSSAHALGYGLLGEWYQNNSDQENSIRAFQQATELGDEQTPLYQWQYQIAQGFEVLGNDRQAERYYKSAIALIEKAQRDISPLERYLKLNFQASVRPIYDSYSELELRKKDPNISKIFEIRNQYNIKVVEFYLGCGKLENLDSNEITQLDPTAAYVSIFQIGSQYFTVLKQGENYSVVTTEADIVNQTIENLSSIFFSANIETQAPQLNTDLQKIYQSIFQPIEDKLMSGQTIVFLGLDPKLQKIPMASLFDGQKYLIQKHPIGLVTNPLQIPPPNNKKSLKSLFAGLVQMNNKEFDDLLYVEDEAEVISANKVLLNDDFTSTSLAKAIQNNAQIVHIATHGQFSSNPEDTFLLASDKKLTITDLRKIVKGRTIDQAPIELLILSACETAAGDQLATLGLAGISIEAGSQSTLASLWKVMDFSTPYFMERVYRNLRSGKSKAQSVQLAQIEMISEGYAPYSWAPYILTGNWQ